MQRLKHLGLQFYKLRLLFLPRTLAATLWWFTAAPKRQKYNFWGVIQPPGVAEPLYSRGHN